MSEEKITLTPQEMETMTNFCHEAARKASEIMKLFPRDTRGMMLFMFAAHILQQNHPVLLQEGATERIAEWMAAGQPEDLKEVVPRILARTVKEDNEQRPN